MRQKLYFLRNSFLNKKAILVVAFFTLSFFLFLIAENVYSSPTDYSLSAGPGDLFGGNKCSAITLSWSPTGESLYAIAVRENLTPTATNLDYSAYIEGETYIVFTNLKEDTKYKAAIFTWAGVRVSNIVTVYTESCCENHCSPSGKKQCTDNTHYVRCGNYDSDPCTEWSSSISCPSGQTCSGAGVCSAPSPPPCSNECWPPGESGCVDNTHYRTCGNYDSDPCTEWSPKLTCPSGQTCSGGVCSALPEPANQTPNIPSTPQGPTTLLFNDRYTFSTSSTDPDGDNIKYIFDWGDGSQTAAEQWYPSGVRGEVDHVWYGEGNFIVKAKACDSEICSNWSSGLTVNVRIPEKPILCGEPADENYQVCYYEGTDANINKFISNSDAIESGPKVEHDWGTGAIGGTTRADDISATWRGYFNFEEGKYNISCFADNGIIIKVNDNEAYREFADDGSVYAVFCDNPPTLELSGRTKIEVIWNEKDGNAALKVDFVKIEEPSPCPGWIGNCTIPDSGWCSPSTLANYFPQNTVCNASAVCYCESTGNPWEVGGAGERGLFQILPSTAQSYGLDLDSLFDPVYNINGALLISNNGSNWGPWSCAWMDFLCNIL